MTGVRCVRSLPGTQASPGTGIRVQISSQFFWRASGWEEGAFFPGIQGVKSDLVTNTSPQPCPRHVTPFDEFYAETGSGYI